MTRAFSNSSTEPILAGVKWHEQYNCYRTQIAGWLDLTFSYESTRPRDTPSAGYRVTVAGVVLKARGTSPEDAARIAVAGARILLAKALKELEDKTA